MKEKLLKKVQEEAAKLEGKVSAYFVPKKGTDKTSHCEIRMIDNGKLSTRGFILHLESGKVNNGELFESKLKTILGNIFKFDDKGNLTLGFTKIELKKDNFKIEYKTYPKKIRFFINGNTEFVLRKVNKDGNYYVSQAALWKAFKKIEETLIPIFRTSVEDFTMSKDLIEAVANYLFK